MKNVFFFFFLLTNIVWGQDYSHLQNTFQKLNAIAAQSDSVKRYEELNNWWSALQQADQIPLVAGDSVLFLYKGKAKSVDWMGDFNGWGYNKNFQNKGKHIQGTDVWILKASFPNDARLDYKIVVNENNWILDPDNRKQQWSGVGGGSPNSELRMSNWKEDAILTYRDNIAHGKVKNDILLNSHILGYQITYSVYLPASAVETNKLPVIYVTDGYEYMLPQLGNMITVLDNLIADKKIKPIAAVFVDNREPVNRSNNRRMQELAMNSKYLDFFVQELIPEIETHFPISKEAKNRAILGTSMGGLTATYFAFTKPDVFGLAGIQSPAFWTKPQIYSLCSGQANPEMVISITSGLINDTSEESRKMKAILQSSSCVFHYREVNEGHSWGNWRNLLDDILIDLFAPQ